MTADDSVPQLLGNRVVRYADSSGAPLSVARVAHREGPVLVLIVQAVGEVAEALDRITIDARSRPRISDVRSVLCRHHAARPVDLVLVDYLQLLSTPGAGRSRVQEAREIAVALKRTTKGSRWPPPPRGNWRTCRAWSADAGTPRTPAARECPAAAHAADLILELERLGRAPAGARYASYPLRLRKLRQGSSEGTEQEVLFDRTSYRFIPAR
jgi:hypothetical protein